MPTVNVEDQQMPILASSVDVHEFKNPVTGESEFHAGVRDIATKMGTASKMTYAVSAEETFIEDSLYVSTIPNQEVVRISNSRETKRPCVACPGTILSNIFKNSLIVAPKKLREIVELLSTMLACRIVICDMQREVTQLRDLA